MNDQKKRKFKGSVLFTVVFVMSILIVLLFGTLTLAYATNSRSHVNYSSAQTGITSRLVTESSIRAIGTNEDYANAISALNSTNRGPLHVKVGLSSSDSDAALGTMGHGDEQHDIYTEIEYAGKKEYFDIDKNSWQERDLLKFTSTVSQAGVSKSSTAYVIKHKVGDKTGGSSGGAGFVTTAGAVFDCQTSLYGGSYINLPDWDNNAIFDAYKTNDADELKFYEELSTKSETERGFPVLNTSSPSNTALWLNNAGGIMEADTYVYNNVVPNNWSGFYFPDKDTGITIWGDLYAPATNTRDHLKCREGESLKKYDKSKVAPADLKKINFNEIPYIYVNGKIHGGDGFAIELGNTTDPFPLNVFCGSIDTSNLTNGVGIAADIYCMDTAKKDVNGNVIPNKIGSTGSTTLYSWTASVVNGYEPAAENYVSGSIFSNSDLELTNLTVNGDVRVNGHCKLGNNVKINGKLVAKSIEFTGNKPQIIGSVYCDAGNCPSDLSDITTSSRYVRVPTKEHKYDVPVNDAKPEWNVVENYPRLDKFFEFRPTELTNPYNEGDGWNGLFGEPLGNAIRNDDGEPVVYYSWKNPNSRPLDYENLDSVKDYIDQNQAAKKHYETGQKPYIEALIDVDPDGSWIPYMGTNETDERCWIYDEVKREKVNSWKARVDRDGRDTGEYTDKDAYYYDKYADDPNIPVDESVVNSEHKDATQRRDLDEFGPIDTIYPKYATRGALLGLSSDPSINKSETQVVKPLSEILKEVANPYDYSDASQIKDIKQKYEGLPTLNKLGAVRDSSNVNSAYYESITDIKTGMTQSGITTVAGVKMNKPVYINKSCVLNLSASNGDTDGLVFDPGDGEMLVVIEKLDVASGVPIYVDDTTGGKVYFYIEGNGTEGLTHNGGGNGPILATVKYAKALKDNKVVKYNSPSIAGGYDLGKELGKPNAFIFGGSGSKFNIKNMTYITANIISPNTDVKIDATSNKLSCTNVYYNDLDVQSIESNKTFVFGCLNAGSVTTPNIVKCIYVTDDGDDLGGGDVTDDENWYKLMYYSEY